MRNRFRQFLRRIFEQNQILKAWFKPHRRAALRALLKASILLGAISEATWLLNTHYFSRRFVQLPLSLAWSMLAMIAVIMYVQIGLSLLLKLRSMRMRKASANATVRLETLLASYVSGADLRDEIGDCAILSPEDFEACVIAALLGMRGSMLERLRELPDVSTLRERWIGVLRKGNDDERRAAAEKLGLLRDPLVTVALERSVDDLSPGVAAAAIRGLLRLPDYAKRDELVRSLPGRPYLVRVLTASESADDAARLAPDAAVELLELAKARGRAIGNGDLRPALNHRDKRTRRAAMRLVPLASPSASPARGAIMIALRNKTLEMHAAAAEVAGRLRFALAIPSIEECARESANEKVVRASCSALAKLGTPGRDALQRMSAAGEAGEAPAEALGEALAASARGGRA